MLRLLYVVRHGTEALVYSDHPRSCSLLVSGHNLRVNCQCRTLVSPLNSGANAALASVQALVWVVVAGKRVFDIRSLSGDEWS